MTSANIKRIIKYKYALDDGNNMIDIAMIDKKLRSCSKYYCISCGRELIAKLGDKNKHHFAHKVSTDTVLCSNETYLHKLAKLKIKEIFDNNKTFTIRREKHIICSFIGFCEFSLGKNSCSLIKNIDVNLKQYYDLCNIEKPIKNFKADILLENSIEKNIKPILIEILVTHPCSEDKINSKLPIIEIPITSEEDIIKIEEETKLYGKSYNISPKEESEPMDIDYTFTKYALFESGKYKEETFYDNTCKYINKTIYEKALLELSVYKGILGGNYFLFHALSLGYNIKDCSICQNYDCVKKYDESYSLCKRYKKDNTPKTPHFLYAYQCPYYKVNGLLYEAYKKNISKCKIKIIKNDAETFNNLDLKNLYSKYINNTLNECISLLEKCFKNEQFYLSTESNMILLNEFYDKYERFKENEFVYYLKLYHSTTTYRQPLYIYCIEENYKQIIKSSTKAIQIKIKDSNILKRHISNGKVILHKCNYIAFYNIKEISQKTIQKISHIELVNSSSKEEDVLPSHPEYTQKKELYLSNHYKEEALAFIEKEFNTKNIFIEIYGNKPFGLKSWFDKCEKCNTNKFIAIKLCNQTNKHEPIYIQLCYNHESPRKDIPTIVLRLDIPERWKEYKYQNYFLIKQGKNGEFYKIKI